MDTSYVWLLVLHFWKAAAHLLKRFHVFQGTLLRSSHAIHCTRDPKGLLKSSSANLVTHKAENQNLLISRKSLKVILLLPVCQYCKYYLKIRVDTKITYDFPVISACINGCENQHSLKKILIMK